MMRKLLPGLGLAVALACGSDRVRPAAEVVEVVGGTPTVGQDLPGFATGDGGQGASFGPAAPFQVDVFTQQQVQQVDILWVVDNSPSMKAKQDQLKNNFQSFMQYLTAQQIDYHLGVVTTDTFDPNQSGRLQNLAAQPQPWINADAGNPGALFVQNASVGELGSGDEKGLLGAMLALTPPLATAGAANCVSSNGRVDCFLRPKAALYTVIISDEEDSSCTPVQTSGLMTGEGCLDADIRAGGYGTTDYWSRFFSGAKDGGVSRLATIVTTESATHDCATEFDQFCRQASSACATNTTDCHASAAGACCSAIYQCDRDIFYKEQRCHVRPAPDTGATTGYQITGQWNGCVQKNAADGGVNFTGIYAPRYATVAQATGGIATSICDQDYTPALSKLGLQASGLRTDFPLSRAPLAGTLTVRTTPEFGWTYVGCEKHVALNVLRFAAPPPAGTKIAVSYDVNVRGLAACP